ncbi:hypothetical protein F5Y15DRAFT_383448 [Xylariaceae sp. FL0016]|nr:hypothetical protein F5Y15DRAFT_383448 [Xylariaceae sp. FL0016]
MSAEAQREVMELYHEPNFEIHMLVERILERDVPHLTRVERERRATACLKFNTNSFEIADIVRNERGEIVQNKTGGLFTGTSRFNHSCDPNVEYNAQRTPGWWLGLANRNIAAGDELTITYIPPTMPREQRQSKLRVGWGFECTCHLCQAGDAGSDSLVEKALQEANQEMDGMSQDEQLMHHQVWQYIINTEAGWEERASAYERRVRVMRQLNKTTELFFAYYYASHFYEHLGFYLRGAWEEHTLCQTIRYSNSAMAMAEEVWKDRNHVLYLEAQDVHERALKRYRSIVAEV